MGLIALQTTAVAAADVVVVDVGFFIIIGRVGKP